MTTATCPLCGHTGTPAQGQRVHYRDEDGKRRSTVRFTCTSCGASVDATRTEHEGPALVVLEGGGAR
jgi:RNase P subunit RPR2